MTLYVLHGRRVVVEPDPGAWAEWMDSGARVLWSCERHGTSRVELLETSFLGMPCIEPGGTPVFFSTAYRLRGADMPDRRWFHASWRKARAGHERLAALMRAGRSIEAAD